MRGELEQRQPGPRRRTSHFLRRALATLRADTPARYAELVSHMRGAHGIYRVDDETFTVTVHDDQLVVTASRSSVPLSVWVDTTAGALLSLVDGTVSLEELLGREALVVRANPDALLDLTAGVRVFSRAAVDSSGLQQLFDRYRVWVLRRDSGSEAIDSGTSTLSGK